LEYDEEQVKGGGRESKFDGKGLDYNNYFHISCIKSTVIEKNRRKLIDR
jgi:hypothetical protein